MPDGLHLTEWAGRDLSTAGGDTEKLRALLWASSHYIWAFESGPVTVAIAGVYDSHLAGRLPELWLILTSAFARRLRANLLAAREQLTFITSIYPRLLVRVDAECPNGQRFVEFLGFTKVCEERMINGRDYIVCEVNNG